MVINLTGNCRQIWLHTYDSAHLPLPQHLGYYFGQLQLHSLDVEHLQM